MRSVHVRMLVTVVLVAGLGLAACGNGATDPPVATASPTSSSTPSEDPSEDPGQDPAPSPSPSPLAGEPYDGPPLAGTPASLAVVGVAADDVLHVRSGPGTDTAIVADLAPLATRVAATGRARQLSASIWLEVAVDGTLGWASSSFLGFLGRTDDITSQLVAEAGALPSASTLTDLALDVAARRASTDPPSRVVISSAPSAGDLGEVTVDVIGLGDDAQLGERLVVFATLTEETVTVMSVEATQLCARGPGTEAGCP